MIVHAKKIDSFISVPPENADVVRPESHCMFQILVRVPVVYVTGSQPEPPSQFNLIVLCGTRQR